MGGELHRACLRAAARKPRFVQAVVRDGLIEALEPRWFLSVTVGELAAFNGTDGSGPVELISDAAGNLYGTTAAGGAYGTGTVFGIPAGTRRIITLASFAASTPAASDDIVVDKAGDLFGSMGGSGPDDGGTIFDIAARTHQLTTLAAFDDTEAGVPGNLLLDTAGDLFGSTDGGTSDGTLFEIAAGTKSITTLFRFDYTNGASPSSLVLDAAGNLDGTTFTGGIAGYDPKYPQSGAGSVFQYSIQDHQLTTLYKFHGTGDGAEPDGLVADLAGNLYGTTLEGGGAYTNAADDQIGLSVLFKIAVGTHAFSKLATLNASVFPDSPILDANGDLFGSLNQSVSHAGASQIFELPAGAATADMIPSSPATDFSFVDDVAAGPGGTLYAPADFSGDSPSLGSIAAVNGTGFVASPALTLQPVSQIGVANQSASFTAAALGYPTPTIQWQRSTDGGKTFSDITSLPSATSTRLTLTDLSQSQNGNEYRAVFHNSAGSATSRQAKLTVAPLLLVSSAHASPSMVTGVSTTLSALLDSEHGEKNVTYAWSLAKAPAGAAKPSLSTNDSYAARQVQAMFHEAGHYRFRCNITDGLGHTLASDVTVDVQQQPTSLRLSPHDKTIRAGQQIRYRAVLYDQFGHLLRMQPPASYSILEGSGTIGSTSGILSSMLLGNLLIQADDDGLSATVGGQIIP